MIRHTSGKLVLAVAVVLAWVGGVPGVASADHGHYAHWGNGFDPYVEPLPALASYTFNAMDRWNSFGVRTQLRRGVQDGDCDIVNGEISVCGRNRGFATGGFIIGETAAAVTQSYLDSSRHTRASVIEVCQNCGYSNSFLQHLLSHELGHALALAHTRDCASAVQGEPNCGHPEYASSPHERDSLRYWYNHTS